MPSNRLLSRFPADIRQRFRDNLRKVELKAGEIIHRARDRVQAVYFPLDCVIAVIVSLEPGSRAQIARIGNREMVGLCAFLGTDDLNETSFEVQLSGTAIRAPVDLMLAEFRHNEALRDVLLKFTQAYVAQISRNVACACSHTLTQRLARFLLEAHSFGDRDEIALTHESIAIALNVRRASVTDALTDLEESGAIRGGRGVIVVRSERRLHHAACDCFDVLEREYNRLLGKRGTEYDGSFEV